MSRGDPERGDHERGDHERGNASAMRRAYQASSHGLAFAITLAFGVIGGTALDDRWDSSPACVLVGFAIGLTVGLVSLIRAVDKLERDDRKADGKPQ